MQSRLRALHFSKALIWGAGGKQREGAAAALRTQPLGWTPVTLQYVPEKSMSSP